MNAREPIIIDLGPVAQHNQRCAILKNESAVLCINTGVFHPSWKAQQQGWHIVKADTWVKRLALSILQKA